MELILEDEEIKEVTLDDFINPNDFGKIIISNDRSREGRPTRDDLTKEIVAYDAIDLGPTEAGKIHGIEKSSAGKYGRGENIANDDVRAKVLAKRHDIADTATAKLMEALNLFDPNGIEKQTDLIKSASMLSNIVERVSSIGKTGDGIQLHLYAPKQNSISNYEIIEAEKV